MAQPAMGAASEPAAPPTMPPPLPVAAAPAGVDVRSGSTVAPDEPPPAAPPAMPAVRADDPTPVDEGPPPVISGKTEWAGASPAPEPEPAPPLAPPSMAAPARPSMPPRAASLAPAVASDSTLPPSDDLSDLAGPGAVAEACARVFSLVQYHVAPQGELPDRDAGTRSQARTEAQRLLSDVADRVPGLDARPLANRIANELCGLGPLSAPLAEPEVREIFVHGPQRIFVRRGDGAPEPIDATFSCRPAVEMVVRRLTNTWFGIDHPIAEARTFDGADVHAIHDSVSPGGPVVTITLPDAHEPTFTLDALAAAGDLSPSIAHVLRICVEAGLNIAVCAAPGARSFPLLAALAAAVPASQRVALVRIGHEPGELAENIVVLQGDGLVSSEGATVMQALVRAALGLAPDRLYAHEVAGAEASEVLAAAGRGMGGAVVSTRAGSAEEGIRRLATLCGLASGGTDHATRARYVAGALEVVVTLSRFPGGRTRVTQLAEAMVDASGRAGAVDLVTFDPNSRRWGPTGVTPSFFAELQRRGISVDPNILND
jgi:pilus assembly protein CpaF